MKKQPLRHKPKNKKRPPPILVVIISGITLYLFLIVSTYILTVAPGSRISFSFQHLTESVNYTLNNIIFGVFLNPEGWRHFFEWFFKQ